MILNRTKVEEILKLFPELVLEKSQDNDSPLQRAAMGLNWHMWEVMLKYLPKEKYDQAAQQLDKLKNGTHFIPDILIDALNEYRNIFELCVRNNLPLTSLAATLTPLLKKIGMEQRMMPIALLLEYCRADHSYTDVINPEYYINDTAPPSHCILKCYQTEKNRSVSLHPIPQALGNEFFIFRGEAKQCEFLNYDADIFNNIDNLYTLYFTLQRDRAFIEAWYSTGKAKLFSLMELLERTPSHEKTNDDDPFCGYIY